MISTRIKSLKNGRINLGKVSRYRRIRKMTDIKLKMLSQADRDFGNKAVNLSLLMKKGFEVPQGFAVKHSESFPLRLKQREKLRNLIHSHIDEEAVYVVRSSANIEDSTERSFAGQFESVLNLQGTDEILSALEEVAKSFLNGNIDAYSKNR